MYTEQNETGSQTLHSKLGKAKEKVSTMSVEKHTHIHTHTGAKENI